jgi:hypothetical protein
VRVNEFGHLLDQNRARDFLPLETQNFLLCHLVAVRLGFSRTAESRNLGKLQHRSLPCPQAKTDEKSKGANCDVLRWQSWWY